MSAVELRPPFEMKLVASVEAERPARRLGHSRSELSQVVDVTARQRQIIDEFLIYQLTCRSVFGLQ